jgi:preprotein translocase subunit SecF
MSSSFWVLRFFSVGVFTPCWLRYWRCSGIRQRVCGDFDRIRENFRRYRKMNTLRDCDNAITSSTEPSSPRLDARNHGAVNAVWRTDLVLLCVGFNDWYLVLAFTHQCSLPQPFAMWLGIKQED